MNIHSRIRPALIYSLLPLFAIFFHSCGTLKVPLSEGRSAKDAAILFDKQAEKSTPDSYEELTASYLEKGQIPKFMNRFVKIKVRTESSSGEKIRAKYYVAPDFLCIGSDDGFIRVPMRPATAQAFASRHGCFLSTPKISDDTYRAARVKLTPVPMTCEREAYGTFLRHNYIIEGQRKGRRGLIAGHKKDVVITVALAKKDGKLALYGWHKPDGKPIQPVYTGHSSRYVDYSHGFRLVYGKVRINSKNMDYRDVLSHDEYYRVLDYAKNDMFTSYPLE